MYETIHEVVGDGRTKITYRGTLSGIEAIPEIPVEEGFSRISTHILADPIMSRHCLSYFTIVDMELPRAAEVAFP